MRVEPEQLSRICDHHHHDRDVDCTIDTRLDALPPGAESQFAGEHQQKDDEEELGQQERFRCRFNPAAPTGRTPLVRRARVNAVR